MNITMKLKNGPVSISALGDRLVIEFEESRLIIEDDEHSQFLLAVRAGLAATDAEFYRRSNAAFQVGHAETFLGQ